MQLLSSADWPFTGVWQDYATARQDSVSPHSVRFCLMQLVVRHTSTHVYEADVELFSCVAPLQVPSGIDIIVPHDPGDDI